MRCSTGSDGSAWFDVQDPEGNKVEFVQPPAKLLATKSTATLYSLTGGDPIGRRIIHVGMFVRSRENEDKFYRELLGFKPYWYGGMHADHTDWVSQQVPDGHDWLEYMVYNGQGAPDHITQQQLGVLNHFSLGVVNMEKTVTTLYEEDRLGDAAPRPQIGRDGKWQFNIYDPDLTRVETDGILGGGEAMLLGVHGGESDAGGTTIKAACSRQLRFKLTPPVTVP